MGAAIALHVLLPFLQSKNKGKIIIGVAAALLLIPILTITLLLSNQSTPGNAPPGSDIPAVYVPMYQQAEKAFKVNWFLLAALHKTESTFSQNEDCFSDNWATAGGPMQFTVETWPTYQHAYKQGTRPASYPKVYAPHPHRYDDFDSIMAAGLYLKSKGAKMNLDHPKVLPAVAQYKGGLNSSAFGYARETIRIAKAWEAEAKTMEQIPSGGGGDAPVFDGGGVIAWPVRGPVTSPFGPRWGRMHEGIDIGVPNGTKIGASADGRVSLVQSVAQSGGYGNFVCIAHSGGLSTCYAHLTSFNVHTGQTVHQGQLVGPSGCTGSCQGPHLHFEVRKGSAPLDPMPYLKGKA